MVAGLVRGLDHEDAARFSFLLATPIIFAAGIYKVPDLAGHLGDGIRGQALVGSIFAGLAAYALGALPHAVLRDAQPAALRDLLPRVRRASPSSASPEYVLPSCAASEGTRPTPVPMKVGAPSIAPTASRNPQLGTMRAPSFPVSVASGEPSRGATYAIAGTVVVLAIIAGGAPRREQSNDLAARRMTRAIPLSLRSCEFDEGRRSHGRQSILLQSCSSGAYARTSVYLSSRSASRKPGRSSPNRNDQITTAHVDRAAAAAATVAVVRRPVSMRVFDGSLRKRGVVRPACHTRPGTSAMACARAASTRARRRPVRRGLGSPSGG